MSVAAHYSDSQVELNTGFASLDWVEAPLLAENGLSGTFWSFSTLQGHRLSPFLVLAPEGMIGNFFHPQIDMWQIIHGKLCFINAQGLPSIIFNVAQTMDAKIVTFAGRAVIDGVDAIYVISRTDHPKHPIAATPAHVERRANFLTQPVGGPLRPNLIVVPANSKSLHPNWFTGVGGNSRSWDLCVGYYGEEQPIVNSPYEYLAHLPKRRKFKLLFDLFYEDSPLWQYERIWLPDDDLMATGADLNLMFHLSQKHGLDLAQPSLRNSPDCHINHPITGQKASSIVRHEPFVEIMCPMFSSRALRICIGGFKDVDSGYGLDHLWPSFLGRAASKMGIIDAMSVVHTRPIGATYDVRSAIAEQAALWQSYGYQYVPVPGVR